MNDVRYTEAMTATTATDAALEDIVTEGLQIQREFLRLHLRDTSGAHDSPFLERLDSEGFWEHHEPDRLVSNIVEKLLAELAAQGRLRAPE